MMKALSLWQPWAGMVAAGLKPVDTRTWPTSYRGELAIHATVKVDQKWREHARRIDDLSGIPEHLLATKAIVAVADLYRVALIRRERDYWYATRCECHRKFAWSLASIRALPNPVPCPGARRIWNVPPDVEIAIREQLES